MKKKSIPIILLIIINSLLLGFVCFHLSKAFRAKQLFVNGSPFSEIEILQEEKAQTGTGDDYKKLAELYKDNIKFNFYLQKKEIKYYLNFCFVLLFFITLEMACLVWYYLGKNKKANKREHGE